MSRKSENNAVRTVEDYVFGCVNFEIPSECAATILNDRGLEVDAPLSSLDTKTKELLKADLYVWICMGPGKVTASTDSDNGWSHSGGGFTLSSDDKDRMLGYAYDIYDKYDEESPADDRVRVTIESHGIAHCDYDCFGNPLPHTIGFE